MRTGFAWVATFAAAALAAAAPAFAQSPGTANAAGATPRAERLALVIGNGAYRDAPLPNPTNDAADVAKALEASGFTVIRRENVSLREMHLALREFGDRLGRTTTGLFYFAGHGLQVRGRNYLLPVDADIAREDEVSFAALDLAAVLEKMDSARNPVNLVVLDACRNNPFGNRFQLAAKGLAQVDAPPGTFIAFATAPGSVAADGIGRNGLYTHHLLREMKKPGAAIEEVFKSTRAAVRKGSSGQQVPWESTSLETAFSFIDPPPAPKVAAAKNPRPAPAAAVAAQGPARAVPKSIAAPPTFAVGDSWSYVARDLLSGKERRFTIKVREIRDEQVRLSNGTITDPIGNLLRTVSSGVESLYTPSSPVMPFPLQPGAALSGTYVQRKGDRHYDTGFAIRVVGEEEIEVPAGRFRAIRIERTAQWSQKGAKNTGTQSNTYWYSAAVRRLLANEVTNVTTAGKVLQKERIELEAYELR